MKQALIENILQGINDAGLVSGLYFSIILLYNGNWISPHQGRCMHSSQNNLKHFIQADEIAFIEHALAVAKLEEESDDEHHGDYEQFDKYYQKTALINNLRHAFISPHDLDHDDLREILTKLPVTERMALLDLRPQIIKDFNTLEYILTNFIDRKDRLLFALHYFEFIYHIDAIVCRNNILAITALLNKNDNALFLNFAINWAKKINESDPSTLLRATKNNPHASAFSFSFILSSLSTLNHLFGGNSLVTTLSGLLAITTGLRGLYKVYQGALEPSAYRNFIWAAPEPTPPELPRRATRP